MSFDIKKARRADTAPFSFVRLSLDPRKPIVLHVRHLGSSNKEWMNSDFQRERTANPSRFDLVADSREQDMADLAKFCIVSWDGVTQDGKPADCTPDAALAFLKFALENGYDDEIDTLRMWAKILANFREPIADGASLGKE